MANEISQVQSSGTPQLPAESAVVDQGLDGQTDGTSTADRNAISANTRGKQQQRNKTENLDSLQKATLIMVT
ncbi:hypothetical protein Ddc_18446 [Ditylenchus destructor]|nr:hypothetical protein Ddc_18446 [Ditylenchus destructor]